MNTDLAYVESMRNVCKLLRDAASVWNDGPDDRDKILAEDKTAEAIAIARQVCKDLNI